MASEATDSQPLDTIRFRPSKKRKVYRSRADEDEDDESDRRAQIPSASTTEPRAVASDFFGRDDSEETTPQPSSSVAAALRHRPARRGRLQGVGFSTRSHATTTDPASDERALVPRHGDDDDAPAQIGMANRFTQQTGLVSDIDDKHIRAAERAPPPPNNSNPQDGDETADRSRSSSAQQAPGQPVMQGKLVEVDLASHPIPAAGDDRSGGRESKRQRLGRDGKPWRPRKRRGSDDIKRDKLVEEFLSENRRECPSSARHVRIDLFTNMALLLLLVGVYDVSEVSAPSPAADGEADERLAEEFRRQFLDDVARRRQQQQQRKKKPTQAAKPGSEDVLRGPKLGGSRNQRAAVRDILLKKEKEAKK
ncbi:unnamed protein product [Clonostachys rhizophaga]|uniref:Uncharacterized protein n=1 Tax=Clonostachys rhizophaga TaxID=160324 RepID=A0A9N9V356_9HYPO|nr:unnamed protein product [Clonostachys rhizophaga]